MRLAEYQIVVIKCLYALNYEFFPLHHAGPTDLSIPGSADKNSLFKNEFYAFCKGSQIFFTETGSVKGREIGARQGRFRTSSQSGCQFNCGVKRQPWAVCGFTFGVLFVSFLPLYVLGQEIPVWLSNKEQNPLEHLGKEGY